MSPWLRFGFGCWVALMVATVVAVCGVAAERGCRDVAFEFDKMEDLKRIECPSSKQQLVVSFMGDSAGLLAECRCRQ